MKKITLLISAMYIAIVCYSQTSQWGQVWTKTFGGNTSDYGSSITTDDSGNVYITGNFFDTVDFDPGAGIINHISNGLEDVFVQKLDASGNFLWGKTFGGYNSDFGNSITTDTSGNVYITGFFDGIVDFDPGAGTANDTSNGYYDVFVQKLDVSGNFLWAKTFGGDDSDYGESITTDDSGNVYITGRFENTVDFDPGAGIVNHTSNGGGDVFVQKLDASGNFLWAKTFGGDNFDHGESITTDDSGNVHITGNFRDIVDFDPGAGTVNDTSNGFSDVFVQKLDASGNFLWAKTFGGDDIDHGKSITTDDSGNVYITGNFRDVVDFNPDAGIENLTSNGLQDVFMQKLDPSGNFLWAKTFGGDDLDYGQSITTDTAGNAYIIGEFISNFYPGAGIEYFTSNGFLDVFVQKLDASGNFQWAKTFGGDSYDLGNSITIDDSGNIYITGIFEFTVDFDPGAGTEYHTSNGVIDVFISKFIPCTPTSSVIDVTTCDSYTSPSSRFVWTTSGTYSDTTSNITGCDSIITINLTIINSTTNTINPINCYSYTSPSGNYTWTSSGTYLDTIPNQAGCDSIITINLTINNSTTSTISPMACYSYTSPSGKYFWATSGVYLDTIPNASGCDSIITINLFVGNTTTNTINPIACDSYTSPSGKYTWTSSGTYTDTIPNATGCDSIITINLTINNSTASTISPVVCYSYTSPSGNHTWTASGTYSDTIPNTAGCDSIITINLTINNSTSTINPAACESYTNPSGKYTWTSSGTYTDTIPNEAGCDSIITINLTVYSLDTSVIQAGPLLTSNDLSANHRWVDCDNGYAPIDGETSHTFTATNSGNYAVIITKDICVDTSACYEVQIVDINNNIPGSVFTVYPNPTYGLLNIDFNDNQNVIIEITGINGQLISRKEYSHSGQIDISANPEGIYFMKVISNMNTEVIKILLQR